MPHARWPVSAADRDPVPTAVTADQFLCRRHSNTQSKSGSVSVGPLSPFVHKVLFDPSQHLWWVWSLIVNVIFFSLPPSCWSLSFALECGVSFYGKIQHSPVDGCSAAGLNFGVDTGEDEYMSFYYNIFFFPIILWDNFCDITIFQFVGHPPGRMISLIFPILQSHCGFFFVFVYRIYFW